MIFNTDEARLFYSERVTQTLDFKGNKRVVVSTIGGDNEKKAFTLVLGATNQGKLYPPIIILGGKELTSIKKDPKKIYSD